MFLFELKEAHFTNAHSDYRIRYVNFCGIPFLPIRTQINSSVLKKVGLLCYHSIGACVLSAVLIFGYLNYAKKQAAQTAILEAPQRNDFYILDLGKFSAEQHYQKQLLAAKVMKVDDTHVHLLLANYSYHRKRDLIKAIRLDNLMHPGYFTNRTLKLDLNNLSQLASRAALINAYRPEGLMLFGGIVRQPERPKPLYHGPKFNPYNQVGLTAYQAGDFSGAFNAFSEAAEAGDSWGQYNLATLYRDGEGVEQDFNTAKMWFTKAADLGNQKAKTAMQVMCEENALCQ